MPTDTRDPYVRIWIEQPSGEEVAMLSAADFRRVMAERAFALAVIQKHYATIAGHLMRLQEGHESRAAAEWEAVAHDFASALGLGQDKAR